MGYGHPKKNSDRTKIFEKLFPKYRGEEAPTRERKAVGVVAATVCGGERGALRERETTRCGGGISK